MIESLAFITGSLVVFFFGLVVIALALLAYQDWKNEQCGNAPLDTRLQHERWRVWPALANARDSVDQVLIISRLIGIPVLSFMMLQSRNPRPSVKQILWNFTHSCVGIAVLLLTLSWIRPWLVEYKEWVEFLVPFSVFLLGVFGSRANVKKYKSEGTEAASWFLAISRQLAYIVSAYDFILKDHPWSAILYLILACEQFRVIRRFSSSPINTEEGEGQRL